MAADMGVQARPAEGTILVLGLRISVLYITLLTTGRLAHMHSMHTGTHTVQYTHSTHWLT